MSKPFIEASAVAVIALCMLCGWIAFQIRACYNDQDAGRAACLSAGGDAYRCCMAFTIGHSGKRPEEHCAPHLLEKKED